MAPKSAFHELLDKQKGVVFADDYTDPAILQYLSSQMATLADAGIKTLFIPMFRNTPQHREWMDNISKGVATEEERSAIKTHLAKDWCNQTTRRTPEDYMKFLDSAHKNGIRVIGLETTATDSIKPVSHSNASWNAAVFSHQILHPEGKFALLGGKFHTDNANRFSTDEAMEVTRGIDKMLGVPCVTFSHTSTARRAHFAILETEGLFNVTLPTPPLDKKEISR